MGWLDRAIGIKTMERAMARSNRRITVTEIVSRALWIVNTG